MTEPTREQVEREIADWLRRKRATRRYLEQLITNAIQRGEYRKDKA